jgi:hypothetical protein
MIDLNGGPKHICVCGSKIWDIQIMFENGGIALYFLDMKCSQCGTLSSPPTKLDGGTL